MTRKPVGMRAIEDIPRLRSRERRSEALFVDCYDESESLAALEVYLSDALQMPFEAIWRKPGATGDGQPITVLEVAGADKRERTLLKVKLGKHTRTIPANQVWAVKEKGINATVLNDNREWYDSLFDFDDEDDEEEDEE